MPKETLQSVCLYKSNLLTCLLKSLLCYYDKSWFLFSELFFGDFCFTFHLFPIYCIPMIFDFKEIDKDLYQIRKNFVVRSLHGSDISGPYWMLIKVEILNGSMWHISDRNIVQIENDSVYIFVPPYGWTTEYYKKGTRIQVQGLISRISLKEYCEPILFTSSQEFPTSFEEISGFLDTAKNKKSIGLCTKPSSLSQRAKNILDKEFANGIEIQEIAKRLKTSSSVLSRSFKKDFGHPLAFYKGAYALLWECTNL